MLKIGLTGGMGSGKTTVCRMFEVLGIPVFYADETAKSLMKTDLLLKQNIIKGFGVDSYSDKGELNRKYISSLVFSNKQELDKLNAMVHPAVFRAFDSWVLKQTASPYVIKEAALLFESNSHKMCDQSVLIKSPEALRIQRIIKRDVTTQEEAKLRMIRQFSDERKEEMADHVILNDEQNLIIPQVLDLHQQFLKMTL